MSTLDQFVTIIVPAGALDHLRKAGEVLGIDTTGMYRTGLSADSSTPATHYISSGLVYPRFVEAMQTGDALYDFIVERTAENGNTNPYSRTEVQLAHAQCDVSADDPYEAASRLGLLFVASEEP